MVVPMASIAGAFKGHCSSNQSHLHLTEDKKKKHFSLAAIGVNP
jgi:hypothetical protein